MKRFLFYILAAVALVACNIDEDLTTPLKPSISIEQNRYQLKVGQSVELRAEVENVDSESSYSWSLQGVMLSSAMSYRFEASSVGSFLITLTVTNIAGSSSVDFRIDVRELAPPVVSFAVGDDRKFQMVVGRTYEIRADVESPSDVALEWRLDGKVAGSGESLELSFNEIADHALVLIAQNEDGRSESEITLSVGTHVGDMIHIEPQRHVALGRTLYLEPTLWDLEEATFEWRMGGQLLGSEQLLKFTPSAEGEYQIQLKATANGHTEERTISVVCHPSELQSKREKSSASQKACNRVYSYTPAPGQFINEKESGFAGESTLEEATAYAEQRLSAGRYVSLGAWGGEIVVGFDHSVEGGFSIGSNFYDGSSEAGIVWVSQDTNRNGQPDDEWYELRGSEWAGENHRRLHAISYFKSEDGRNIMWRDNKGQTGCVYRNATHTQSSYFPRWIEGGSYTLYGSWLKPNTEREASGKYVNRAYAWGYADNKGQDATQGSESGEGCSCVFKIENAVNPDGSAAELLYIDFVKVQTAICHSAGELGEISTEVSRIEAI
ncbi:MAG: PKD domain-containing protein [Alistipes sp.]|nr:PKD domain-containing protein [Alistipes sp.]